MIQADQLSVARGGRVVLAGAHLTAEPGEVVGVVGPNGSGKTTLLLALNRALRASGGTVVIDGDDLSRLPRREIARRIAVVAQDTETALPLKVRDAVGLGRLARRTLVAYGDASDRVIINDALERVEASHLADRLITQLSGGERQRVLVARAIAQRASHLLLDEPTNHLALHHQFSLLRLVLHDLNLAARFCTQLLVINGGEVVASGTPDEVLTPDILEPIYHLRVRRIAHENLTHLIFSPETESKENE